MMDNYLKKYDKKKLQLPTNDIEDIEDDEDKNEDKGLQSYNKDVIIIFINKT